MALFLFFWASLFHDENSTLLMDKFDLFIFRDLATLYLKVTVTFGVPYTNLGLAVKEI
jgi:hypothetical protein